MLMSSRNKLANRLRSLSPQSDEFYAAASKYFWQRVRSHRNYGRFFLLLATASWALLFLHWGRWMLAVAIFPSFLFSAFLGWIGIAGAARAAQALRDADQDKQLGSRLQRLREIALSYPGDNISIMVLEVIDTAH